MCVLKNKILTINVLVAAILLYNGIDRKSSGDVETKMVTVSNEKADKPDDFESKPVKWKLVLVNNDNPIDEKYISTISLTELKNGQAIDGRCYPYLQQMMDDCRAAGFSPVICSSFRTYEKQQSLFREQVQEYMKQGMSLEEAEEKTAQSVAIPGRSEHELGLSVDITNIDNQKIISGMESTPVQRWLMKNCWKYGFILRYPLGKSHITGIVYEPWHFRYVGKEAAKEIYSKNITLEEYLKSYSNE